MLQIPKGKEAVLPYALARIYTYTHKRSHTHIIQYIYMHLGTHIRTHKHTHTKWSWTSARDFCFNACLTSSVLNRFSLFRLKIECEKLASEKTEMQRHYVMVRHFVSSPSCFFIFVSSTAYSRQLKISLRWHPDQLERIRWIVALLSGVVTRFFGAQRFVWRKLRKLSIF